MSKSRVVIPKAYEGQVFFSRKSRKKSPIVAPILHRVAPEQRLHSRRKWGRSIILVFTLLFIMISLGTSYLLSGGRDMFKGEYSGVNKNDMFYRFFAEDEARDSIMGPQGGPDVNRLKLYTYVIGKDDSLSKIANKTGCSLDALISINKLQDAHMVRVGTRLKIPNQKGVYYTVRHNDTLAGIANKYKKYGTTVEKIKTANGIDKNDIKKGYTLFVPDGKLSKYQMEKALGLIFRSPARGGWISSGYGYRRNPFTFKHQFHPGIDIALPFWTPIRAIRSGKVIFSGWRGGYGKLVVMRHTRGYSSRYGHMVKYVVRAGQWIRAGQVIGYVGSTGNSTGPHLHFELRRYGKLRNPFKVKGFRRAYRRGR